MITQKSRLEEGSPSWHIVIWDIASQLPRQPRGCWRVSQQQFRSGKIHIPSALSPLTSASQVTLPSEKLVSWSSSPVLEEEVNKDGWILELTTWEADRVLPPARSFPSEEWFTQDKGIKEMKAAHPTGSQSWVFTGRTDAEAEIPVLRSPDSKNWLLGKDPDAGKDWGQEERGTTEDEMVGWHHRLDGHESEQAPVHSGGQRRPVCGGPRGLGGQAQCSRWPATESITVKLPHPCSPVRLSLPAPVTGF